MRRESEGMGMEDVLSRAGLFRGIDPEAAEALASHLEYLDAPRGEVVFLEGEMLYNSKGDVPDEEYTIPIGEADVKREGGDVTIVSHSKTVAVALKAKGHAGAWVKTVD